MEGGLSHNYCWKTAADQRWDDVCRHHVSLQLLQDFDLKGKTAKPLGLIEKNAS